MLLDILLLWMYKTNCCYVRFRRFVYGHELYMSGIYLLKEAIFETRNSISFHLFFTRLTHIRAGLLLVVNSFPNVSKRIGYKQMKHFLNLEEFYYARRNKCRVGKKQVVIFEANILLIAPAVAFAFVL